MVIFDNKRPIYSPSAVSYLPRMNSAKLILSFRLIISTRVVWILVGIMCVSSTTSPQESTGSLQLLNTWPFSPQLLQYITVGVRCGTEVRFSIE